MTTIEVDSILYGPYYVHFIGYVLLFIEFVYVFFAFLLVRQIKLMNKSFKTPMGPFFTFIGKIHFIAAIVVAGISFLVLL
ncbi:MAG: hypothetical protein UU26_C0001G0065 [Candidatus Daviesbacteria bacterium GW2011_GWC1_40_9]|nr:MAG: hypothetical protein UU26_C0001G0065 [Candidatus Daviesbacteria bacterium GW2011_GWC1_40_9]